MNHTNNLDRTLVTELQKSFHKLYSNVRELKSVFELVTSSKDNKYTIVIHAV